MVAMSAGFMIGQIMRKKIPKTIFRQEKIFKV